MRMLFHVLTPNVVIKLCVCLVLPFIKENLPEVALRVCSICLFWIVENNY